MRDHEVVMYLHALSVISMVILIKFADHDNRTHNFCSTRSSAILVKILLDQDDRTKGGSYFAEVGYRPILMAKTEI